MAFIHLDAGGTVVGVFGASQDMTQAANAGLVEVSVDDTDPRIATFNAAQAQAIKPRPSPLQWTMRLAQATQLNLLTAARTDTAVALALQLVNGVVSVDVNDPLTIQNVQLLQSKNLLTATEAATLLTP